MTLILSILAALVLFYILCAVVCFVFEFLDAIG